MGVGVEGDRAQLLGWLYGNPSMPMVLAVYPKRETFKFGGLPNFVVENGGPYLE
jgi:hypothetical protein